MIDTRTLSTLVPMALIPFIPLAAITTVYLCSVNIPLQKRVIASMSSTLLALTIPIAFIVAFLTGHHSEVQDFLALVCMFGLPTLALFFTLFTVFHVRTWMNVLQIPNLLFGAIAIYFIALGPFA